MIIGSGIETTLEEMRRPAVTSIEYFDGAEQAECLRSNRTG